MPDAKKSFRNSIHSVNKHLINSNKLLVSFIHALAKGITEFKYAFMEKHNRYCLTEREKHILKFVASGLSNKEIADYLNVSTDTVKKHLQNSYKKLRVNNKIEALQKAGIIKNHPLG
jgi:ATP/maltotriose-dependent transcriptional regulator MalT